MEKKWDQFCIEIKLSSQRFPQLESFFRLITSLLYLFPHLHHVLFTNKKNFIKLMNHNSNLWEIRWINQQFAFQMNSSLRSYLLQEDWWWDFLSQVDCENDPIDVYTLSSYHESLGRVEHRKLSGLFFTPRNQIKVICHYALFYFLRNNLNIKMDDNTFHQIIFQYDYPSNLRMDECDQIAQILTQIRILDPSCGTGIFLVEMYHLLLSLLIANPINSKLSSEDQYQLRRTLFSNLYGYDINLFNVKVAKIILTKQFFNVTHNEEYTEEALTKFFDKILQIDRKDFIVNNNAPQYKFDLIIGNPPYVRHHGLNYTLSKGPKGNKEFLNRLKDNFPRIMFKWDKKADLYIYFLLRSISCLNNSGIVSFVLSRAWLSSRYTTPFKQVLVSYFHLDLIIELPFEIWKDADVRTHIIIGHRTFIDNKPKELSTIVWKDSAESLMDMPIHISREGEMETLYLELDEGRLEINTIETNSYRFTQISDLTPIIMNSEKSFPFLRIDYLSMSAFLINLLITQKNSFCLLKDIGKLEMGSTTGANRFFYLDREFIEDYNLPQENLIQMTKSPKEWQTIFYPLKEKMKYFLHIPRMLSENSTHELKRYIRNIQDEILKRPYFKNKSEDTWYQVPLIQPDLLIPNMTFKRSFVAFNRDKFHIDKQWIGILLNNQEWLFFLLAFLNSTLGVLLREVQGTKTLGMGSLKLSLLECQNLLVIDPRKIPEETKERSQTLVDMLGEVKIDTLDKEQNSHSEYSKIQGQLDHLILVECLGLTPNDVSKLREILKFEFKWRLAKEKVGIRKLQKIQVNS